MIPIRWTLWNLFLAFLPVVLAYALLGTLHLAQKRRSRSSWSMVGAIGLTWLLFVPNACYLLTEWRHFLFNPHYQAARDLANPWEYSVYRVLRHVVFYSVYSAFGMACFALSIRPIVKWVRRNASSLTPLAVPFFFLVSLGVYLGLIMRLNSWDFLTRPGLVLGYSRNVILSPRGIAMVSGFAAMLGLFYLAFDIWMEGLAVRLQRFTSPHPSPSLPPRESRP